MLFPCRVGISVCVLSLLSSGAHAQIASCGGTTVSHSMRQTPNYQRSVDVSAATSLPMTYCPLELQTEAWVDALTSYVSIRIGLSVTQSHRHD